MATSKVAISEDLYCTRLSPIPKKAPAKAIQIPPLMKRPTRPQVRASELPIKGASWVSPTV